MPVTLYTRILYIVTLAGYTVLHIAGTQETVPPCQILHALEQYTQALSVAQEHSFTYYQSKTHEFLKNLYGHIPRRVRVELMDPADTTFGESCPAYASGNVIRLNMNVLKNYCDADSLFICAHEAAHIFCGHTFASPKNRLSPTQTEQEADEIAAQMLCTHGYYWVVKKYVQLLAKDIARGYGDISDDDHPTSAQKYVYLEKILAQYPVYCTAEDRATLTLTQEMEAPQTAVTVQTTSMPRAIAQYFISKFTGKTSEK